MPKAKKGVKKSAAVKRPARVKDSGGNVARFEGLTPKQQQFVMAYLANGFNATQATIAAGYSKKNADTQGSRLLAQAKIRAVLDAKKQALTEKREITAERVLDEIAKMAFLDPRKLFTGDGQLVPITQLGEGEAASIAGLEISELYEDGEQIGRLKKIKIADKARSLEMLGRYLKLFTDKVEHSGSLGVQLVTTVPRPQRKPLRGVLDASRKGKGE